MKFKSTTSREATFPPNRPGAFLSTRQIRASLYADDVQSRWDIMYNRINSEQSILGRQKRTVAKLHLAPEEILGRLLDRLFRRAW